MAPLSPERKEANQSFVRECWGKCSTPWFACKANLQCYEVAGVKPFVAVLCLGRRGREREYQVFFCLSLRAAAERKDTVMCVQNHRWWQYAKAVHTSTKGAVSLKKHKT